MDSPDNQPTPTLEQLIERLTDVAERAGTVDGRSSLSFRSPSRFAGPLSDPDHVAEVTKSFGAGHTMVPRGGIGGIMNKAMAEATDSAGGYAVPTEDAGEIMRLIRARSAVMRMGPRVVPVAKELDVTSFATGSAAYYVAENAAIPTSEPTLAQRALLRPRELAALVPVSNRLLRDAAGSSDLESVIRDDLAEVLALRTDLAFLQGIGTGGEPLGIRNQPGLTPGPDLGTDGGTPDFDDFKNLVAGLRAANAPFQQPGWIFNPRTINTLERLKDSTGRYLADAGLLTFGATGGGGTLLGFPFATSTQIPTTITTGTSNDTSYVIFSSDWSEAWVGENESLRIELSDQATYTPDGGATFVSAFQNRQTLFRATVCHDLALRRPNLFSTLTGVRP